MAWCPGAGLGGFEQVELEQVKGSTVGFGPRHLGRGSWLLCGVRRVRRGHPSVTHLYVQWPVAEAGPPATHRAAWDSQNPHSQPEGRSFPRCQHLRTALESPYTGTGSSLSEVLPLILPQTQRCRGNPWGWEELGRETLFLFFRR